MKTEAEMIAVMQAFVDRKPIEISQRGSLQWFDAFNPKWNWHEYDYRVAVTPMKIPFELFTTDVIGAARDMSGHVYLYKGEKPEIHNNIGWTFPDVGHYCHQLNSKFIKFDPGTCDWQDSWIDNPYYKARDEHRYTLGLLNQQASAQAERDAIAAAAFEAAAQVLDTHGDSAATEALGQRLCCNGHLCGCQGSDVGQYLQHLIRALAPADATARLAQMLAEAERKGMQRAVDLLDDAMTITGARRVILAAMQKEGGK